jgi:hypothetical protein
MVVGTTSRPAPVPTAGTISTMNEFREILTLLSKVAVALQPGVTYSVGFDAGGRPFLLVTAKDGSAERLEANSDEALTALTSSKRHQPFEMRRSQRRARQKRRSGFPWRPSRRWTGCPGATCPSPCRS